MNKVNLLNVVGCHFIILFLLISSASAQDIHFSQFYNAPNNINPALSGVFHGNDRIAINYRNQWNNVPVDYLTFAASYDTQISPKLLKEKTFGLAAFFMYDRAGDSKLYNTKLGASLSYMHPLNSKNTLSGGLGLALNLKGFDSSALAFNSQFDGELYNPDLDAGEENLRSEKSIAFADVALGLNWNHKKSKATRGGLDLGLAIFHLNQPKDRFYDNQEKLHSRISAYALGTKQLSRRFDLLGRGLVNLKGPASEAILGIAGRFFIEPHRSKPLALQLGLSYRFFDEGDAWIPNLEILYKSWTLGLSYDINISEFKTATNRRGGPELALIYRMAKVKPLDSKNCKIF